MIIGVVGPVQSDIQEVVELLTTDKDIQVVDSIDLLRKSDRKTLNSLTIMDYHQQYYLRKLEIEFDTVIVTGNIVLPDNILKWILENGGTVVVVSRKTLESYNKKDIKATEKYWDDKVVQRYNLEVRFQRLFEKLDKDSTDSGNLYLVDLSEENSESLENLATSSNDWATSTKSGISTDNLVDIINVGKDDKTMTMEETIKNAMKELGMEVEDEETVEPVKKSETPKKTPVKKDKPAKVTKEPIKEKEIMNPPVEEAEEDDTESIFVKITGNTMALLIPEGLTLEKQTIGDMNFNVATVKVPDIKSVKLQELKVITGTSNKVAKNAPKVVRTPITSEKEVPKEKPPKKSTKPVKTVVVSGNASDLHEEKARFDAEIKKYRQQGDIDTVNELRKQRRAVRNKINALK